MREAVENFIGVVNLFLFLFLPLKSLDSGLELHGNRLGGKDDFLPGAFDIHVFLVEILSPFQVP